MLSSLCRVQAFQSHSVVRYLPSLYLPTWSEEHHLLRSVVQQCPPRPLGTSLTMSRSSTRRMLASPSFWRCFDPILTCPVRIPAPGTRAILALPILRQPDWSLDRLGAPLVKDPKGPHQEGAYALHLRGEVRESVCSYCKSFGTFKSCVVGPEYRSAAVFFGACSNCIWQGNGSRCSARHERKLKDWFPLCSQ